ncbi:MAG: hypothetical protein E6R07_10535 [Nevskiaceae bacterium]|nr:MAG: hypothetical protein E6R07_10535 [Nevskiaceae bacterium]
MVSAHAAAAADPRLWLWATVVALVCLALFFSAFSLLRRARLLEDTPTSLVRSAAQGYVELRGRARLLPGPPIVSPLSDTPCVWWSYRVQERVREESRNEWRTIEHETSGELFLLADPTGECIIDPDHADVRPSLSRSWRGPVQRPHRPPDGSWFQFGDYRYSEQLILVGAPLYAIGWFRTQNAELEFNESREVSELMAEWKKDRSELLRRFDTDGDGQIDAQEWETARRAAITEVRSQQTERALNPDLHVMAKPPDRRPFILSTLTQETMTRRFRLWGLLCLLGALLLGGGFLHLIQSGRFP